ncbi:thermonuclease family protein [Xanthomonas perforans]|uniref:Succinoglycan biosynthesis protein n=2 Tax=Xanthomonas perforans TaxID=442694 RepID=A0A0G9CYN2_XANPE|nr:MULTISPECIES: thermonuclease family protein [Xanthomonas]APP01541.1 succinoglycan biosynthesis protein [Xanthomonas perforans]AQS77944.1 succinoglycan biosynthesis protein [Xanthomonas perforans 91-118]KLC01389.1 succinoglycan biosynthesis protein [Xanthomonas perforans]KLC05982.1 succinoglycan biosynthesis protein [Xanthomonas perforans]KLC10774.1 succinoglycan biosynthesis protein [Xanthomonas perforans]
MKLLKLLKCWVLSVLVLVALPVSAAELVGRATVTDGDTITVAHQRIRLWGIDAPESAQQCSAHDGSAWPCGRRAAAALDGYLLDKTVHCQPKDTDRYGRRVAECFVQGQSVNAWMVRSGWAVAYRQYATAFEVDERLAQQQRRNLWQGAFQMPADYRRDKKARTATTRQVAASAPINCRIKGNISSDGKKIFHMPGQRDYAKTRISPAKGERFFCSVNEAAAAGWRPARR